ncbi:hypothetical protein Tco_0928990 [Tanacetum coccineum]
MVTVARLSNHSENAKLPNAIGRAPRIRYLFYLFSRNQHNAKEYLLEFTSEYRISEYLHPELPVPGDRIVDFPEDKIGARPSAPKDKKPVEGSYSVEDVARLDTRRTPIQIQPEALLCLVGLSQRYYLRDDVYPTFLYDDGWEMDLFNLISALNLAKVKTDTRLRAAHEVPLLTVTANRVIDMGELAAATESFGTPSTIERSPLDFNNENLSQRINKGDETEDQVLETGASEVPPTGHVSTTGVAPNIVIEEEDVVDVPLVSKRRRKKVNDGADANAPLKRLRERTVAGDPRFGEVPFLIYILLLGHQSSITAQMGEQPTAAILTPPVHARTRWFIWCRQAERKPKKSKPNGDQRIHSARRRDKEKLIRSAEGFPNQTRNLETLLEADVDMKKAAKANMSALEAQLRGDEQINTAFEEFKKRKEDKVERRCAEIDARLDAMSIDFDEELYPHMLTAIAFANVVSARIAKGMSEGLKHGVEHGKAQLDLEVIEAYDPEADAKYVAALHALKDLEYPLIDYLEKLKDAHIDLIMASLHLESDVGEETPQWIREPRPSSSQLKIHVYPEVRDPRDP